MEETNLFDLRKAEQILANPNACLFDDILKIDLAFIPKELADKLQELMDKKLAELRERIEEWRNDEEEDLPTEDDSELPPEDIPQEAPEPSEEPKPDFEKLYYEVLTKLEKKEITTQEKMAALEKEIAQLKSQKGIISEEEYEERNNFLQGKLEQLVQQEQSTSNKQSTNYWPWFIGLGGITVMGLIIYLLGRRKKLKVIKKTKKKTNK